MCVRACLYLRVLLRVSPFTFSDSPFTRLSFRLPPTIATIDSLCVCVRVCIIESSKARERERKREILCVYVQSVPMTTLVPFCSLVSLLQSSGGSSPPSLSIPWPTSYAHPVCEHPRIRADTLACARSRPWCTRSRPAGVDDIPFASSRFRVLELGPGARPGERQRRWWRGDGLSGWIIRVLCRVRMQHDM